MAQQYKQKSNARTEEAEPEVNASVEPNQASAQAGQTVADIDEVLDAQLDEELLADMDDILEEDAERFIRDYVQAGGQ